MSNEVTVPLLPCASLDDTVAFYEVLGFHTTHLQHRPHPYAAMRREDLHLHFFAMTGFDPAQSYSSCLVLTGDLAGLHRDFATAMRAAYGRVLVAGLPRMTRPRPRSNAGGQSGFSIVDPGGNWIRFVAHPPAAPGVTAPAGRLGKALADAVVQADSRGEHRRAARILDSALARHEPGDDPVLHLEVLVYRAEVALVLQDPGTAARLLDRAAAVTLTPQDTTRAAAVLAAAADLTAAVPR